MQHGIAESLCYGDLAYKFKRIVGKPNFSDQFKKIIKRFEKKWIQQGYHSKVCMSGCKPNHCL